MPEYYNIQTYVKCNEDNFVFEINHFIEFLSGIGLDNKYTVSYFKNLYWEKDDNGFMYVGGGTENQELSINRISVHIRPYIMGWTPEVIKGIKGSWLEISLLL